MTTTKLKVLFIDDELNILKSLERLFRKDDFEMMTTDDPEEIFRIVSTEEIALVVSDQRMPKLEGIEVLKRVKEISPNTFTIILTGYADIHAVIGAVNKGNVFRFLTKPWEEDELRAALYSALDQYSLIQENRRLALLTDKQNRDLQELNKSLEDKVQKRTAKVLELNKQLEKTFLESIRLMGSLSELNNPTVGGHGRRVSKISGGMAKILKLTDREVYDIKIAGFLHDIGKMAKDSKFTHNEIGAKILSLIPGMENVSLFIRYHHLDENDQTNEIPLASKIIAVADEFDKSMNVRVQKETYSPRKVLEKMKESSITLFDIKVIEALEDYLLKEKMLDEVPAEIEVNILELKEDMVLSRALRTKAGNLLLNADFKISRDMLDRIWKRHKSDPVVDEIYVYKKSVLNQSVAA